MACRLRLLRQKALAGPKETLVVWGSPSEMTAPRRTPATGKGCRCLRHALAPDGRPARWVLGSRHDSLAGRRVQGIGDDATGEAQRRSRVLHSTEQVLALQRRNGKARVPICWLAPESKVTQAFGCRATSKQGAAPAAP